MTIAKPAFLSDQKSPFRGSLLLLCTPGLVFPAALARAEEAIIYLGPQLLTGSSGGVCGTLEPKQIPRTQILLASPRVYQSGWTAP